MKKILFLDIGIQNKSLVKIEYIILIFFVFLDLVMFI